MVEFVLKDTVNARPETVFDVYLDHRAYAGLMKVILSAELEQQGEPAPNGLGAIRKLHLPGMAVREQVTEYDRPHHYSYRVLSGLPVDEYHATVTFTPTEQGTAVTYAVSVVPSSRLLPVRFPTEEGLRRLMRLAGAQAERNAQAARSG